MSGKKSKAKDPRNENRASKNERAGLVRYSPTYWIHKDDREEAITDLNKAIEKHLTKARKLVADLPDDT